MAFTEAIGVCFSKYTDFSGRAQRSEYWWFWLFISILYGVSGILIPEEHLALFILIVWLGLLSPTFAVTARRLHDINRSGWWQLLPEASLLAWHLLLIALTVLDSASGFGFALLLIFPYLGLCILRIVWLATDSRQGTNRFGPNPTDIGDTLS